MKGIEYKGPAQFTKAWDLYHFINESSGVIDGKKPPSSKRRHTMMEIIEKMAKDAMNPKHKSLRNFMDKVMNKDDIVISLSLLINIQIQDERIEVTTQCAQSVHAVANVLKSRFKRIAINIFPQFLNVVGHHVTDPMMEILEHVQIIDFLNQIMVQFQETDNPDIQKHCTLYVNLIMVKWPISDLEIRDIVNVEQFLNASLMSDSMRIRRLTYKTYWHFIDHFPERDEPFRSLLVESDPDTNAKLLSAKFDYRDPMSPSSRSKSVSRRKSESKTKRNSRSRRKSKSESRRKSKSELRRKSKSRSVSSLPPPPPDSRGLPPPSPPLEEEDPERIMGETEHEKGKPDKWKVEATKLAGQVDEQQNVIITLKEKSEHILEWEHTLNVLQQELKMKEQKINELELNNLNLKAKGTAEQNNPIDPQRWEQRAHNFEKELEHEKNRNLKLKNKWKLKEKEMKAMIEMLGNERDEKTENEAKILEAAKKYRRQSKDQKVLINDLKQQALEDESQLNHMEAQLEDEMHGKVNWKKKAIQLNNEVKKQNERIVTFMQLNEKWAIRERELQRETKDIYGQIEKLKVQKVKAVQGERWKKKATTLEGTVVVQQMMIDELEDKLEDQEIWRKQENELKQRIKRQSDEIKALKRNSRRQSVSESKMKMKATELQEEIKRKEMVFNVIRKQLRNQEAVKVVSETKRDKKSKPRSKSMADSESMMEVKLRKRSESERMSGLKRKSKSKRRWSSPKGISYPKTQVESKTKSESEANPHSRIQVELIKHVVLSDPSVSSTIDRLNKRNVARRPSVNNGIQRLNKHHEKAQYQPLTRKSGSKMHQKIFDVLAPMRWQKQKKSKRRTDSKETSKSKSEKVALIATRAT